MEWPRRALPGLLFYVLSQRTKSAAEINAVSTWGLRTESPFDRGVTLLQDREQPQAGDLTRGSF